MKREREGEGESGCTQILKKGECCTHARLVHAIFRQYYTSCTSFTSELIIIMRRDFCFTSFFFFFFAEVTHSGNFKFVEKKNSGQAYQMSSILAAALDKLGPLHFPQITYLAAKDVLREVLQIAGNDAVIERELQRLTEQQLDTMMKVIYCALNADSKNSSVFLKWHAAVYAAAGPGAIVRVISDKPPTVAPVST
jgi:hypothetical protein